MHSRSFSRCHPIERRLFGVALAVLALGLALELHEGRAPSDEPIAAHPATEPRASRDREATDPTEQTDAKVLLVDSRGIKE